MTADAEGTAMKRIASGVLVAATFLLLSCGRNAPVRPLNPNAKPVTLEFRVVPNAADSHRPPMLPLDREKYVDDLMKNGPEAGRQRGNEFQWFEVKKLARDRKLPDTVEYMGKHYLLLSGTQPDRVMISRREGPDAWGLKGISLTQDDIGQPAIRFRFDETGKELFARLTKENVRNRVAILLDGRVMNLPIIMSPITGGVGIITGDFTEQEVEDLIDGLMLGMPATKKADPVTARGAAAAPVLKVTIDMPETSIEVIDGTIASVFLRGAAILSRFDSATAISSPEYFEGYVRGLAGADADAMMSEFKKSFDVEALPADAGTPAFTQMPAGSTVPSVTPREVDRLEIEVDRDKADRLGVTPDEVTKAAARASHGQPLDPAAANRISTLLIPTAGGRSVLLREVATLKHGKGPSHIVRTVAADMKQSAWGDAVRGLRARLTCPKGTFAIGEPVSVTLELQCFGEKDYDFPERPLTRCQLIPHVNFWLGNEMKRVSLTIENRLIIRKGETFSRRFEVTGLFDALKKPGRYTLMGGHSNFIIDDLGDWSGKVVSNPVEIEIPAAKGGDPAEAARAEGDRLRRGAYRDVPLRADDVEGLAERSIIAEPFYGRLFGKRGEFDKRVPVLFQRLSSGDASVSVFYALYENEENAKAGVEVLRTRGGMRYDAGLWEDAPRQVLGDATWLGAFENTFTAILVRSGPLVIQLSATHEDQAKRRGVALAVAGKVVEKWTSAKDGGQREADVEYYRRLHAGYRNRIVDAVKARDKEWLLRATERFNDSVGGELLVVQVVGMADPAPGAAAGPTWGEAVDGVQVRLVADKPQWNRGETPSFKVEVRNQGQRKLRFVALPPCWKLHFYHAWYDCAKAEGVGEAIRPLGPGAEISDFPLSLGGSWGWQCGDKPAKPLFLLWPGKESVRVAITLLPARGDQGAPVTVESNPVEIKILPATGDPGVFAGTTKIELVGRVPGRPPGKTKTVVLTDKAEIDRLLKTIRLDEKGPCECEHMENATFTTPKGRIEVSLCDHCFDFGGKYWKMPREFYELFMSRMLPPQPSETEADAYRRLHAEYKALVLNAAKADDKEQLLRLTKGFNDSHGGSVLYAYVERIPGPGQHFGLLQQGFSGRREIPTIHHYPSDRVHVTRLEDCVAVESNENADGTYPDGVNIGLLFRLPAAAKAPGPARGDVEIEILPADASAAPAMDALVAQLKDKDPTVQAKAATGLGALTIAGDKGARQALAEWLRGRLGEGGGNTHDALIRLRDHVALPELTPEVIALLDRLLAAPREDQAFTRMVACEVLGKSGDVASVPVLLKALRDPYLHHSMAPAPVGAEHLYRTVWWEADKALRQVTGASPIPAPMTHIPSERAAQAATLAAWERWWNGSKEERLPGWINALKLGGWGGMDITMKALAGTGAPAVPALVEVLKGNYDARPRGLAAQILGNIGPAAADAVPVLVECMGDKNELVFLPAMAALGKIGDRRAVDPLTKRLAAPERWISDVALDALAELTKADFGGNAEACRKWWEQRRDAPQDAAETPVKERRVHVFVSGRVQGVGFRDFTQGEARKRGLTGWVRNLEDGRVEAVIEGPADKVAELLEEVKHGPPRARVDKVETTDETPTGEFKVFEVRYR